MRTLQMQIDFNNLYPLRPNPVGIHRPASAKTHGSQNGALQIVTLLIYFSTSKYSSHVFTQITPNTVIHKIIDCIRSKQAVCSEKVSSIIEILESLFEDLGYLGTPYLYLSFLEAIVVTCWR